MFVEIRGTIHNMEKYSKVTKELLVEGAGENKIVFWDKTSNIEFLSFGADEVGMMALWDSIKTATACITV